MRGLTLVLVTFLAVLPACAPHQPGLGGSETAPYTCCNLYFDESRDAYDANYRYGGRNVVPVGTRVRVIDEGGNDIRFEPEGGSQKFKLTFKFGRKAMPAGEYFRMILVPADPRVDLQRAGPRIAQAVEQGELLVGMTKAQALMARGYPPFHRTAGVEADEWIYYESRSVVDRVQFVQGKIASIAQEAAPR